MEIWKIDIIWKARLVDLTKLTIRPVIWGGCVYFMPRLVKAAAAGLPRVAANQDCIGSVAARIIGKLRPAVIVSTVVRALRLRNILLRRIFYQHNLGCGLLRMPTMSLDLSHQCLELPAGPDNRATTWLLVLYLGADAA